MLHPATELRFIGPDVGYGVFAREPIPRGTVTWALDPLDQVVSPTRASNLEGRFAEELERYSWLTRNGDRILCWDFGRYMNHSCEPNSAGPGLMEFEVALRDVQAGEELTCDYGTFNLERPMTCHCGSPACRIVVRREDFARVVPELDRRVRDAFAQLDQVPQPLAPLLTRFHSQLATSTARPWLLPSLLENRLVTDTALSSKPASNGCAAST